MRDDRGHLMANQIRGKLWQDRQLKICPAEFDRYVGANALIGGSDHDIELQPVSLQEQAGLNVAAGVAGIQLRWVPC